MGSQGRYDGNVQVGGEAQTREVPGLSISKLAVGDFNSNAYVLRCSRTGAQLLVDAAAEAQRLLALCDGRLDAIVTTHQHRDHWGALAEVAAETGAPVAIGEPDADGITVAVADRLTDGQIISVGDVRLKVLRITGHTPGGIALLYEGDPERPHLFTGDSLFPGGPGNTWNDAANFALLMADLQEKVFDDLPDETWVYPGHGTDTTVGAERPSIPEWIARGW
jgi:glyoxylase-like metal-dependent hydrolase (beta-lactamase superfamily II)